jgi:hypothetical protein
MTDEELRTAVRTIWREVLEADVDDGTDFFDAGGTSFAALRIIAMLNDRHGTPTPVKMLFDNSRFIDFLAVLDKKSELSTQG